MRCKSCNIMMTEKECRHVLHITEDGKKVYNDWCFSCTRKYGTYEALNFLYTKEYQFESLTKDKVSQVLKPETKNKSYFL